MSVAVTATGRRIAIIFEPILRMVVDLLRCCRRISDGLDVWYPDLFGGVFPVALLGDLVAHSIPAASFWYPSHRNKMVIFIFALGEIMCTGNCIGIVLAIEGDGLCVRRVPRVSSCALVVPTCFNEHTALVRACCVMVVSRIWVIEAVNRGRRGFRGIPAHALVVPSHLHETVLFVFAGSIEVFP